MDFDQRTKGWHLYERTLSLQICSHSKATHGLVNGRLSIQFVVSLRTIILFIILRNLVLSPSFDRTRAPTTSDAHLPDPHFFESSGTLIRILWLHSHYAHHLARIQFQPRFIPSILFALPNLQRATPTTASTVLHSHDAHSSFNESFHDIKFYIVNYSVSLNWYCYLHQLLQNVSHRLFITLLSLSFAQVL